tara:strand:+ start:481 stop:1071 length:591 start_codon:yes stop_codon:yes gene_type:complete
MINISDVEEYRERQQATAKTWVQVNIQPMVNGLCDKYKLTFDTVMGAWDFHSADKTTSEMLNNIVVSEDIAKLADNFMSMVEQIQEEPEEYDYSALEFSKLQPMVNELNELYKVMDETIIGQWYVGEFLEDYKGKAFAVNNKAVIVIKLKDGSEWRCVNYIGTVNRALADNGYITRTLQGEYTKYYKEDIESIEEA